MIHVAIDTNILRRFVNVLETDVSLMNVLNWSAHKQIQILAPKSLLLEWKDKHRAESIAKAEKALKEIAKDVKKKSAMGIDDPEPEAETSDKRILYQIEQIDILLESSPDIPNYGKVLQRIEDLRVAKTAPFFNSDARKDNTNDARIIFLSLEWMKVNGGNELVFVSDNSSEFESKDEVGEIHKLIQSEYPNIKINYFKDSQSTISFLKGRGLQAQPLLMNRSRPIRSYYQIKKDIHVLDQLVTYIDARFKEWNFLPAKFITKHYPFVDSSEALTNAAFPFTIVTNNKSLYDFLSKISVNDDGEINHGIRDGLVENAEDKVVRVLKALHFNFLSKISWGYTEQHNLATLSPKHCCICEFCTLKRFKIKRIASFLGNDSDDVEDLMKRGYLAYKVCQYDKSIRFYTRAMLIAQEKNLQAINFICQFSLDRLKEFINATDSSSTKEIVLTSVPLYNIEETLRLLSAEHKEIAEWIYEEKFIDEVRLSIHDENAKIRRVHRNKSSGFSNSLSSLYEQYSVVSAFLMNNCLIYDEFMLFRELFEPYFEGLIASLTSDEGFQSKLNHLRDSELVSIVFYGDRKGIKSLLDGYLAKGIKYQENSNIPFYKLFSEYLEELLEYELRIRRDASEVNFQYERRLMRYLENFLVLSAYLDLNRDQLLEIFTGLLRFLNNSRLIVRLHHLRHDLNKLIKIHGVKLDAELLFSFLELGFKLPEFQAESYFSTIRDELDRRAVEYCYSDHMLQHIEESLIAVLGNDSSDKYSHLVQAILIDKRRHVKLRMGRILVDSLSNKFSPQQYYIASIYGLLKCKKLHTLYMQTMSAYVIVTKPSARRLINTVEGTDFKIDGFLNYVFSRDIILEKQVQDALGNRGDYYEWLLNLDDFNYEKFQVSWLSNYYTKYYRRRFKQSKKLRSYLKYLLERQSSRELEIMYLKIYSNIG